MQSLKRGILIAIEGIDGSGKTSLSNSLYQKFTNNGFSVLITKEPGGSLLGKKLRTILQEGSIPRCPKAEYLLFAADRAQHFQEVIIPALQQKKIVISDRLSDSSLVYQGYGRNVDLAMINDINQWTMEYIQPDLVCFISLDPTTARERLHSRQEALSTFDQETYEFVQKLIVGFETVFKNNKLVIRLDGEQSQQQIAHSAFESILQWITKNNIIG